MKKLSLTILVCVMLGVPLLGMGSFDVIAFEPEAQAQQTVPLTEAQKNELATLNKELMEKKKQVISKYVEFGVLSEEKGKKIMSKMEKHYSMLEQNGFIPNWDKYRDDKGKPKH